MFIEGSDKAEYEADADTDDFQGCEGLLKDKHVEHEGERDTHVLHDSDRGWVCPLVDPSVQVLSQVIQDAQNYNQYPNLPCAVRECNVKGLLLRPYANSCHHCRHESVVPLNDEH